MDVSIVMLTILAICILILHVEAILMKYVVGYVTVGILDLAIIALCCYGYFSA